MADPVLVPRVSRDKLAKFFGGNQEMIKLIENLTEAVAVSGPDAVIIAQGTADQALALAQAQALGVFPRRPDPTSDVRPGDGILVVKDAAGAVVSIDLAYVVQAVRAFIPHIQQATPTPPEDSNSILAGRAFRK